MTLLMDMIRGGKTTKIDRYGWEVQDKPGRMEMIDKACLEIDYTYQRDGNDTKVNMLARDWSWLACGVITVAQRGQKLFVVDGQHRVLAARKRSDIDLLPCIVFKSHGIEEEANGFLVAQTQRKAPSTVEKFRALLATGDHAAITVKGLVERSGRRIAKTSGPTTVKCVGVMMKIADKDTELLERVWQVVESLCKGKAIIDILVLGLAEVERRMKDGHSITDPNWQRRIAIVGAEDLIAAAKRCAAYKSSQGGGNFRAWADGMTEAINKGLRNRLPVRALRK